MRAVAPRFIACPSDLQDARIVVYGIPFEGRVNLRKGACGGPRDLRLAPDTREEFLGERYNYASAMARVMDVVPAERVYQVGMRTGSREEYERRRPNFYPVLTGHPREVVRRLLPELRGHPLYVTIDVDVLDPAEAPGTGSAAPRGLPVPGLVEIVPVLRVCR